MTRPPPDIFSILTLHQTEFDNPLSPFHLFFMYYAGTQVFILHIELKMNSHRLQIDFFYPYNQFTYAS